MSDTTAVNTGPRKGINTRLQAYFNKQIGRDIHSFECLLHVNELYLSHFLKFFEGDSKTPNKMEKDSLYNVIEQLEPMELTSDTIKPQKVITKKVRVSKTALEVLDQAINLASTWKREWKPSVFCEDHLRMLVLAGKLYRNIPDILQQYLFHRQKTITQSRWCTTASGYLRMLSLTSLT